MQDWEGKKFRPISEKKGKEPPSISEKKKRGRERSLAEKRRSGVDRQAFYAFSEG